MFTSTSSETLFHKIAELDKKAFDAYNSRDLDEFKKFFLEDLEFYHDKSGLISSRSAMIDALKVMLCDNNDIKIRRELIKESLKIYPIANFGAIQVGEHCYYKSIKGQTEKIYEAARFTHIWKNEGSEWKITRVLSYDHQPLDQ